MAAPLNDDSKVLFRLLADRQWHNYEELLRGIEQMVPPGRAMRKYDQSVRLSRRGKADPDWDPGHDDATRIELGRRRIAYAAVSNWIRQNALEARGYRKQKEIRVIPGYTSKIIPGYEPSAGQDPGLQAQGQAEVPRGDSEPSEVSAEAGNEVSDDSVQVRVFRRDGEEWVRVEDGPVTHHRPSPGDWPPMSPALMGTCDDCGLAISDPAKHDDWHQAQVKPDTEPEMALLNTSQLQDAVRVVVSQELARFQSGMQGWLVQQFMQLEGTIAAMAGLANSSARFDPVEHFREQT